MPAEAEGISRQDDPDCERGERMHQDEALDEALKLSPPLSGASLQSHELTEIQRK
jgi:hypothetical protein